MPRAEIISLLREHLCWWGPKRYADPESVRISEYLGIWNDQVSDADEFAEYVQTVSLFFACTISQQEIRDLHRKKAKISELVDILAERAPRRCLQPRVIFCKPCLPAAVFEELLRVASAIKGQTVEAAPSTQLIAALSRPQLRKLVLMASYYFPKVPNKWKQLQRSRRFDIEVAASWGAIPVFIGIGIVWYKWLGFASVAGGLTGIGLLGLMSLWQTVLKRMFKCADQTKSPFNERVRTFRDLVDFLLRECGARYIEVPQ